MGKEQKQIDIEKGKNQKRRQLFTKQERKFTFKFKAQEIRTDKSIQIDSRHEQKRNSIVVMW